MKFKIGDVCRVVGCAKHQFWPDSPGHYGSEVTIIGYLDEGLYAVDPGFADGVSYFSRECCLELKRPPPVELGKWEECPWQPNIEVVK